MFRKHELVVKNKHLVKQACNAKKSRVKISQTYSCIARERNGVDQLAFTQKVLENAVSELKKLELIEGDANGMIEYFQKMSSDNQNFFHLCRFGKDGALQDVLWVDARSRAAYEEFGDVVCFDSTYLTNRFHLPFVVFLGVNHHGQSILLGCALISRETVETYAWVFKTWLNCMSDKAQTSILTDQEPAIRKAVHLFLRIDDHWMDAIQHYKLQKNSWLEGVVFEECELILYGCCCGDHRLKSIALITNPSPLFVLGKTYVGASILETSVLGKDENNSEIRAEAERIADSNTLRYVRELATAFPAEEVFQKCYTDSKFKEVQQKCKKILYVRCIDQIEIYDKLVEYILEDRVWIKPKNARKESVTKIHRCYRVMYDSSTFEAVCDCKHFECHGIICRHMIFVYDLSGVGIVPEKYILRRWRKDMQRKHTRVKVAYHDPLKTDEVRQYHNLMGAYEPIFSKAASYKEVVVAVNDLLQLMDLRVDEVIAMDEKKRKQEMEENVNEQQQPEDEGGRGKDLGSCEGSFADLSGAILDLSGAIPDQSGVIPDPPLPKKKNHRTTNKRYPSCTEKKGKEKAARAKNAAKKLAAKNSTTSVTLSSHEYIRSAGVHMTDLDGMRSIRQPVATVEMSWISAKNCSCSGAGLNLVEFRISMSEMNPMRPYYKCRLFGNWEWVVDGDLVKDGPPPNIAAIVERVEVLEHHNIN
ncbi:protein FAR1-RELATED SEQUENCE 6-like [Chenopodium quinoa]|uniref:protein FAR1-RELATED SEQUENCE 6-like n=1 Tax=Chenopodium quinoa TaxID=63459 RepID=UPI000B78C13F|nr:protein FAR1-RELATED SEQUENCE 6-like [Chenopodium quinoa]